MKNFKFLSSLVAAGMLTTGIVGTSLAATDVPTEPVGIYKQIIEGKNIVPFVLNNRDDIVTVKDLVDSKQFTNIRIDGVVPSDSTVLKTGDVFKANGDTEYTVVVYGDVNKDGQITIMDALDIQDYRANITKLDDIQLIAANVIRADGSGVNIMDALHIQDYRARVAEADFVIDETPAQEPAEEIEYDYDVTINGNDIVNNQNHKKSTATIEIKKQLTEEITNAKLVLVDDEGKDVRDIKTGIKIPAYTDRFDVTGIDFSNAAFKEATTLKGKLVDTKNKNATIAEFTFEKHTKEIANDKLANVSSDRWHSRQATLSFDTFGDSKVVKMYYIAPVHNADLDASSQTIDIENDKTVKSIDVVNGKVDEENIEDLTEGKAHDIYYILEDEYGSRSIVQGPICITIDGKITSARDVKIVKVPDLTKATSTSDATNAVYTWEFVDGKNVSATPETFTVTLYKGEEIINESTVNGVASDKDVSVTLATLLEGKKLTPGTYHIVVRTNGASNKTPSNVAESEEITIEELKAVRDITYSENEKTGAKKLSWESDYNKDDIGNYSIDLVSIDKDGNEKVEKTLKSTDKFIDITNDISDCTLYKAVVTVVAKSKQIATVSTDNSKAESGEFFYIDSLGVITKGTTTDTAKFELSKLIQVAGKTTKYSVEIYETTGEDGWLNGVLNYVKTVDVTVNEKTKEFEVTGLEDGKEYAFILKANVDGVEGKSGYIYVVTTKINMPNITELKVVADNSKTAEGEIAITKDGISIEGEEYKNLGDYDENLAKVRDIVDILEVDDVITYTSEKVTIDLGNRATTRKFGTTLKGMTVELEGDGLQKTLTTDATDAPKEVILSGEGAILTISGLNVDSEDGRIVIENGVEVKTAAGQDLVLAEGAEVVINGVTVSASTETKINANKTTFTVTANNGVNDLTFNNPKGGVTIYLAGDGYGATQEGSIKVTATGAVTINGAVSSTGGVNVKSELDITATNGNVNVEGVELTGEKSVTVEKTEDYTKAITVKAKAAEKAPFKLSNLDIQEYDMTKQEDMAKLTSSAANGVVVSGDADKTSDNIVELNKYLSKFNLSGTGAKITVAKDSEDVTITIPGTATVDATQIGNLK